MEYLFPSSNWHGACRRELPWRHLRHIGKAGGLCVGTKWGQPSPAGHSKSERLSLWYLPEPIIPQQRHQNEMLSHCYSSTWSVTEARGQLGTLGGGGRIRSYCICIVVCSLSLLMGNRGCGRWCLHLNFLLSGNPQRLSLWVNPFLTAVLGKDFFYVNYQEGIILRLINFQDEYKFIYRSISFQTHREPFVSSQTQTGRLCFKFQFQLIIRYI